MSIPQPRYVTTGQAQAARVAAGRNRAVLPLRPPIPRQVVPTASSGMRAGRAGSGPLGEAPAVGKGKREQSGLACSLLRNQLTGSSHLFLDQHIADSYARHQD